MKRQWRGKRYLSIEWKTFELQADSRFLEVSERGNGRVSRVCIPNEIVEKALALINKAAAKQSTSLKDTFCWNGQTIFAMTRIEGHFFLSRSGMHKSLLEWCSFRLETSFMGGLEWVICYAR